MRLPSITTPLPVDSLGASLSHGLYGFGSRMVENTFTTERAIRLSLAVVGAVVPAVSDFKSLSPESAALRLKGGVMRPVARIRAGTTPWQRECKYIRESSYGSKDWKQRKMPARSVFFKME